MYGIILFKTFELETLSVKKSNAQVTVKTKSRYF